MRHYPKYNHGDRVFHPKVVDDPERYECPDCLGQKTWAVKAPSGLETTTPCPRCSGSGQLLIRRWGGAVEELTIGQIRMCDPPLFKDSPVFEYKCNETGIQSGSVYPEYELFTEYDVAKAAARVKVTLANEKEEKRNPRNATLRQLYRQDIVTAEVKDLEDKLWKARNDRRRLLDRVCELDEYPVAGGRYSSRHVTLTKEQIAAVQEHVVWLDEDDSDYLDEWRNAE